MGEASRAVERLSQFATQLSAWRDDCVAAREWGGPTIYPSDLFKAGYATSEERADQIAKDIRAVLAALSSAEPGGWRLVPVEMTEEMVAAAWNETDTASKAVFRAAWRAMLSAAPKPPSPENVG